MGRQEASLCKAAKMLQVDSIVILNVLFEIANQIN